MRLEALVAMTLLMVVEADPISDAILKELNSLRDSVLNPLLSQKVPPKIPLSISKSGDADAGCIIPNPFGGCICHADAQYSISIDSLSNLNTLSVTNFTSCSYDGQNAINLTGAIAFTNAEPTGGAHAGCSACGISPSASGTVNTEATGVGVVAIQLTGALNLTSNCIQLNPGAQVEVTLALSLHDTNVVISLGPIPGVNIGALADLVLKIVPELTSDITNAVQGPISDAVTDAIHSGIPCIPVPH